MIQHEFQEQIDKFIELNNKEMQRIYMVQKGLAPQVTLLLYNNETKQFGVFPTVLPGGLLDSEQDKDMLAYKVLPELIAKTNDSGFQVICLSWSTEAWLRDVSIEPTETITPDNIPKNWKDLPKSEAIMISYETPLKSLLFSWKIMRKKDGIQLEPHGHRQEMKSLGGRFQGILNKQSGLN